MIVHPMVYKYFIGLYKNKFDVLWKVTAERSSSTNNKNIKAKH